MENLPKVLKTAVSWDKGEKARPKKNAWLGS
jgi:hypothetical protein